MMALRRLGLIGIGLLGAALAERLLRAGVHVVGWDVSTERRDVLERLGGQVAGSTVAVMSLCDRVLLSLPSHETVAEVLAAADDVLRSGQLIIDTSTGAPDAAVAVAARLAAQGVQYVDATVSGSSAQMREGQAVLLVGATDAAFSACEDVFSQLSGKVFHTGPPGSGACMKLVTNLVLGLNRAALAEGLCFAQSLGLDATRTLLLLRESMAYSRVMDVKGEKMVQGDFSAQAKLSQHLKDVRLMLAAADRANIALPLTQLHRRLLERGEHLGLGEADNSAILRVIAAQQPGDEGG
jgi:3-hydroxyisobutyrate dehydrogenase-like beta-hydroxyacid dehydrogenase